MSIHKPLNYLTETRRELTDIRPLPFCLTKVLPLELISKVTASDQYEQRFGYFTAQDWKERKSGGWGGTLTNRAVEIRR